jgi:predicted small metal-binding protein
LEIEMTRKLIDCRTAPGAGDCTVAISADTEEELIETAVQHAITAHQHQDTPELRAYIRSVMQTAPQDEPLTRKDTHAA